MEKHKILLAEDEPFLGRVVKESLEKIGYEVFWAQDGMQAWKLFCAEKFSVIVLDVMMPVTDGFALAAKIRMQDKNVPLMFLTAKSDVKDVKEGYASGGNDYLRKPFSLDELFLRIEELIKRSTVFVDANEMQVGQFLFSRSRQELIYQTEVAKLSHREAELLTLLIENKNNILDRKSTLIKLWGDDSYFNTRNMDVYITRLRKKLSRDSSIEIINVRGFGYKLIC